MVADPKMRRARGRWGPFVCAADGCGKTLTEIAVKNDDPFCSTQCCHAYHGIEITVRDREKGIFVGSSS